MASRLGVLQSWDAGELRSTRRILEKQEETNTFSPDCGSSQLCAMWDI